MTKQYPVGSVPVAGVRERIDASMCILVVADDPRVAFPLAWELERLGHRVLGPTGNATRALELASYSLPHLVLLDVNLQGPGDAVELAETLRDRLNLRSVFLSAQRADVEEHRGVALGSMTKRYLPESAMQCLEVLRALNEGRSSPPLPHLMEIFELDAA